MQIFVGLALLAASASVAAAAVNAPPRHRREIVHPFDKPGDGLKGVLEAKEAPLKPHDDSQLLFVQAVRAKAAA